MVSNSAYFIWRVSPPSPLAVLPPWQATTRSTTKAPKIMFFIFIIYIKYVKNQPFWVDFRKTTILVVFLLQPFWVYSIVLIFFKSLQNYDYYLKRQRKMGEKMVGWQESHALIPKSRYLDTSLKYRLLAIRFIWIITIKSVTLQPKGRGFVRVRASSARINVTI